jgi:hypothetical protein
MSGFLPDAAMHFMSVVVVRGGAGVTKYKLKLKLFNAMVLALSSY